jgi:acyl carrier protein
VSGGRVFAQALALGFDRMRSGLALRGATRVGAEVRVFGWPRIACEGELVIGRGAVFISSPAPIELLVARGASLVIGDGVVVESGATLRAHGRILVENCARIGVGCVLDDDGPPAGNITISQGAWIEDGAILLAGTFVPAGVKVPARSLVSASSRRVSLDHAAVHRDAHGSDLDNRIRQVVTRVVPAAREAQSGEDLSRIRGWDSLSALRVLVALEKEFAMALPLDLLASTPRIESVKKVIITRGTKPEGARP